MNILSHPNLVQSLASFVSGPVSVIASSRVPPKVPERA